MRKPSSSEVNPSATLTILSVSPIEQDHSALQAIVGHSTWSLLKASDLHSAVGLLKRGDVAVLLAERDLRDGNWIDVLEYTVTLPSAPSVIVTSRHADDRLWAEALNRGAWDVLAKPFDRSEVIRSVKSGWQHWHGLKTDAGGRPAKAMKAAS